MPNRALKIYVNIECRKPIFLPRFSRPIARSKIPKPKTACTSKRQGPRCWRHTVKSLARNQLTKQLF